MSIYDLLRFLVLNTAPRVESPGILASYELAKKASLDLIDTLEKQNAFGTMAAITKGNPYE